jgi:hypothetical protein
MYSCSSSVKDLAPKQLTRATSLRLLTILTHSSNTKISGQQFGVSTITGDIKIEMT